MSVPNQRIIKLGKREPRDGSHLYATYNLEALQTAMVELGGCGSALKLWLYINKNQDKFFNHFELSRAACEEWGIKKDSYYKGFEELVKHRYLMREDAFTNTYQFFEMPCKEEITFSETFDTADSENKNRAFRENRNTLGF